MRLCVFIAVAALGLAGCSDSNPAQPTTAAQSGSTDVVVPEGADEQGGRPIEVSMTGAAERPGPGDPDGSGTARFSLNPGQNQICWELEWSNIEDPVAAHIHVAPATDPGPVVVPLSPIASGCSDSVDRDLIRAILTNPEGYYVNVHTPSFPAGAIRAQLTR